MIAFPDDYKTLVPKLLIETMLAVNSSFISRINLATGDAVPETKALAKGCILFILQASFNICSFYSLNLDLDCLQFFSSSLYLGPFFPSEHQILYCKNVKF